jgi:hypothetical protein
VWSRQVPGAGPQASDSAARLRAAATLALTVACASVAYSQTSSPPPIRGLSHPAELASAYDAILDADFDAVDARLGATCRTTPAWCAVMHTVAQWWQIALDPGDRRYDAPFTARVAAALRETEAWVAREPQRAEAWFAHGAAYGARAQWRVERRERLAAARDGKHIRSALERALALDPALHDAKFGVGMYRYYADVAPAVLRMLRWLLLLPGGDRRAGLQQMQDAQRHAFVIRGEADYQLHLIYLWYEQRSHDALALIRGLQSRHPRNPLFALIEADIHRVYFHDARTSEVVLRALIARADSEAVNAATLARRRAHAALASLPARSPR